jgi:hypothetical protein
MENTISAYAPTTIPPKQYKNYGGGAALISTLLWTSSLNQVQVAIYKYATGRSLTQQRATLYALKYTPTFHVVFSAPLPRPLPYTNFGLAPIRVCKGQLLGVLEPCTRQPKAVAGTVMLGLSEVFQELPHTPLPEPENHIPDSYPYLVHLVDEPDLDLSLANIGPEWPPEIRNQIQQVLQNNTPLFRKELGSFNDGVFMPISFKDKEDRSDLCQVLYSLSPRDRHAMDNILDPLKEIGVVEDVPLSKPARAASPAFVVWRDSKPRVVVDLCQVNTKLFLDRYPLPRQEDIFDTIGGATIFSVLDIVKSFF